MKKGYFNSPEYAQELKTLDLGPISEEVERYNSRFSMGAMMARMVIEHAGTKPGEEAESPITEREQEDQAAFLQRIENQYGIQMAKSGIGLESTKGKAVLMTADGESESTVLRVNLKDRTAFLAYLSALDSETISSSQVRGLTDVAKNLETQLKEVYSLDKPDVRANELLTNLNEIVEGYKKLDPDGSKGLSKTVEELSVLQQMASKKQLKEHLMIERAGLMAEVGGNNFGPSKWHTDSDEVSYKRYWDQALEVLSKVRANPDAADLAIDLNSNLQASILYAKNELEKKNQDKDNEREKFKLKVLEKVSSKLNRSVN
jgi:hypothetical protein